MSQFNEGEGDALRSTEEQKLIVEEKQKILKKYYFGSMAVCIICLVLYYLKYINTLTFCILVGLTGIFEMVVMWTKIYNPQIKELEKADPGIRKRLYYLAMIGLVAAVAMFYFLSKDF